MTKTIYSLLIALFLIACNKAPEAPEIAWTPYDESVELDSSARHPNPRMRFKLLQSRVHELSGLWTNIAPQLAGFTEADYEKLKPLIYERDIPAIQASVTAGDLTYEKLVQWYLFRIVKYESDSTSTLHTVIAVNPMAVERARQLDRERSGDEHPIYGMPILLKDNINTAGMPTTAGAAVLQNNRPANAFIVERIREKGGIILGKVNLSEWAYFLGNGLPLGYSAVGGQTLNPYARMEIETGGSSSGSGTAMAANYAVGAVGTETSGSILSPSGKNGVVGLKPTIGLLSRTGIVPISYTLDTPGPMTRNVTDNAILLSAMTGEDVNDKATSENPGDRTYWEELEKAELQGRRFGIFRGFMKDSLYRHAVSILVSKGADTTSFEILQMNFEGFLDLLAGEMKSALPEYLEEHASSSVAVRSVADIVNYNQQDTSNRIPYGQSLFEYMAETPFSASYLDSLRTRFKAEGVRYFKKPMDDHSLDAILSINNSNAGQAAMAQYPCLIVPMGLSNGEPAGLTFIGRPWQEHVLLKLGYAFEQGGKLRVPPKSMNR